MGLKTREKLRRRRTFLYWKQNGKCHYCEEIMWLGGYDEVLEKPVPSQCTLEHLYPRGHPLRGKTSEATVAACWKCNNERGRQGLAAYMCEEVDGGVA